MPRVIPNAVMPEPIEMNSSVKGNKDIKTISQDEKFLINFQQAQPQTGGRNYIEAVQFSKIMTIKELEEFLNKPLNLNTKVSSICSLDSKIIKNINQMY